MQLLLLVAAMAAGGYARTVLSPLQETIRLALSLTDNQMAILQGPAIGLPVTVAAIPLGMLIDRFSRARILSFLVFLSLLAGLGTACAQDFTSLLLARSLAGMTAVAVQPVVLSMIADLYPPAQRGVVTTAVIIGQVIGIAAAFALGGMLLTLAVGSAADWQQTILWLMAPMVPMALVNYWLREPQRTGQVIARGSIRQIWEELRHYRAIIVLLALGVIFVETAVGAMLIWSTPMLSRKFSLSPDRVGTIMAVGMLVSGILGPAVGGILADHRQRHRGSRGAASAVATMALLSAPFGCFSFVAGVDSSSAMLITDMTLMLAIAVMGMTLFTIVIPNELRGLCMSMLVAANLLVAFAVAPIVVSLLAQLLGGVRMIGDALSLVCICGSLLAALAFYLARFAASSQQGSFQE